MSVGVRLIGGPCDNMLFEITEEQWDAGLVLMEILTPREVPTSPGEYIAIASDVKTVAYKKKGRDNAAFEFAGEHHARQETKPPG